MIEASLSANASSDSMVANGYTDVIVEGLTSGSVKLQYKLPVSTLKPSPAWTDFPDGSFTSNVYKTIFISEDQVSLRLTGVSNNAGVYVRMASYIREP